MCIDLNKQLEVFNQCQILQISTNEPELDDSCRLRRVCRCESVEYEAKKLVVPSV